MDDDILDVFQRNCLRNVLGTRLTDCISNIRLYKKCYSVPLSRAITKEILRWLGYVLRMKDDRLPKIVLFGQPFGAKQRAGRPRLGECHKERSKENEKFLGGYKEALNGFGWRRRVRRCVGLRWLSAAVSG